MADYVDDRWQQLRSSGIAVFDFSGCDAWRVAQQEVPQTGATERELLARAGEVGQVAYETGWALVLGVPIIIAARRGQVMPFAVDVVPVWLEGDGRDPDRLVVAIQIAFYGAHRPIEDSALQETVEFPAANGLRRRRTMPWTN